MWSVIPVYAPVFAVNLFPYARTLQLELDLKLFRLHREIFCVCCVKGRGCDVPQGVP